jgi:hypothetical protein
MKGVTKQHPSAVVKLVGVTEEQAMKGVGDDVDVVVKGSKVAKGKLEALPDLNVVAIERWPMSTMRQLSSWKT